MPTANDTIRLSPRYEAAVAYAREQHAGQVRKGSQIPYLAHLLAVSSMVLEHGGNEDQAIAGLLHDVLEDCGTDQEGVIRERFGDEVADIVKACTDGTAESKGAAFDVETKRIDWWQRKLAYIHHLRTQPDPVLLVSGCDKLHNALAIVGDLENPCVGNAVFDRFKGGMSGTLQYYHSLSQILTQRNSRHAHAVQAAVARMHQLAGVDDPLELTEET